MSSNRCQPNDGKGYTAPKPKPSALERYNERKADRVQKAIPKLQHRFKMAEVLLAENTPESRKRYKQMSEHSYGRTKHNLHGFWNGSGKTERKRPMKAIKTHRGITTFNRLRGE